MFDCVNDPDGDAAPGHAIVPHPALRYLGTLHIFDTGVVKSFSNRKTNNRIAHDTVVKTVLDDLLPDETMLSRPLDLSTPISE